MGEVGVKGLYTYTDDAEGAANVKFDVCGDEPFDVTSDKALSKVKSLHPVQGWQ